jgi:hypothetical protein
MFYFYLYHGKIYVLGNEDVIVPGIIVAISGKFNHVGQWRRDDLIAMGTPKLSNTLRRE